MRPVVTLPVPVGPRKQDNVNIPLVLDQVDASVMIASAPSPVDPVFQDPTGLVGSVSGRRRAPESASPAAPFHLCVHQSDERLGVRRHQGFVPGSNFVEHDSHGSACSRGRQATPTFARSLRAAIPAMWPRSRKRRSSAPKCGHAERETMPMNACRYVYECVGCGVTLRPLPGDCCVFCSYADHVCPPKQSSQ